MGVLGELGYFPCDLFGMTGEKHKAGCGQQLFGSEPSQGQKSYIISDDAFAFLFALKSRILLLCVALHLSHLQEKKS